MTSAALTIWRRCALLFLVVSFTALLILGLFFGLFVLNFYSVLHWLAYFPVFTFVILKAIRILNDVQSQKNVQFSLRTLLILCIGYGTALALNSYKYQRDLSAEEVRAHQEHLIRNPTQFGGQGGAIITRMEERCEGFPFSVCSLGFWFNKPLPDGRIDAWYPPDPEDPEFAKYANFYWILGVAYIFSVIIWHFQSRKVHNNPTF